MKGYPWLSDDGKDRDKVIDELRKELAELRSRFTTNDNVKELRFSLSDLSPEAIAVMDVDGHYLYVNPAFCAMTGYSSAELFTMRIFDVWQGMTESEWQARWKKTRSSISGQFNAEFRTKSGLSLLLTVSLSRMIIDDIEYMCFFACDVTRRMQAEEKLHKAKRTMLTIKKCEGTVVRAKKESVLLQEFCNTFVHVGGYPMAWIGYTLHDPQKSVRPVGYAGAGSGNIRLANVTWEDNERGRGPASMAIRTKRSYVAHNVFNDPGFLPWQAEASNRGYASALGLPLISTDEVLGALVIYSEKADSFDEQEVSVFQGLTDDLAYGIMALREREKTEKAKEALRKAKAQAELCVDLMGHDINNMNQVALGYLELVLESLNRHGGISVDERSLIERPMESLRENSRLIENIRVLQREHAGRSELTVIDPGEILEEVVAHYADIHGREVAIHYDRPEGCRVLANELLRDVFSNLVGNAIKHSTGPLIVSINVTKVQEDGEEYCRIVVEDNGPGICDDLKGRLLGRLELDRPAGHGLGLYLVKALVRDYRGKLKVEDRVPGDYRKGCRFIVLLPSCTHDGQNTS